MLWVFAPAYIGAAVAVVIWLALWIATAFRAGNLGGIAVAARRFALVAVVACWCFGILQANAAYSRAPQRFDTPAGICSNWERASGSLERHVQRCMNDATILRQATEYQEQQLARFDITVLNRLIWWAGLPLFIGAGCWLFLDIIRWIARGFTRSA